MYSDLVLRLCARMGMQLADAEDVRQTVMVSLGKSLQDFTYDRSLGRFRDYLGQVVRNAAYGNWRKTGRRREEPLPEGDDAFEEESGFEAIWEREWAQHHFRLAMKRLRVSFEPRPLEIFEQMVRGVALPELSAEYGMTREALYKLKHRVKTRLREELELQLRETEFPQVLDEDA